MLEVSTRLQKSSLKGWKFCPQLQLPGSWRLLRQAGHTFWTQWPIWELPSPLIKVRTKSILTETCQHTANGSRGVLSLRPLFCWCHPQLMLQIGWFGTSSAIWIDSYVLLVRISNSLSDSIVTEEDQQKIQSSADRKQLDEVYTRVYRTLKNGITVGGRHFEFLAFGNSQLRDHGCYMFNSDEHLSAEMIREWMGIFDGIKSVAKYAGISLIWRNSLLSANRPMLLNHSTCSWCRSNRDSWYWIQRLLLYWWGNRRLLRLFISGGKNLSKPRRTGYKCHWLWSREPIWRLSSHVF